MQQIKLMVQHTISWHQSMLMVEVLIELEQTDAEAAAWIELGSRASYLDLLRDSGRCSKLDVVWSSRMRGRFRSA